MVTRRFFPACLLMVLVSNSFTIGLVEKSVELSVRVCGPGELTLTGVARYDYGWWNGADSSSAREYDAVWSLFLCKRSTEVIAILIYVGLGITTALSLLFMWPSVVAFPFVVFSLFAWGFSSVNPLQRLSRFYSLTFAREPEP